MADFVQQLRQFDSQAADTVIVAPLEGAPPWYCWQPEQTFDVILVDGPPGRIGRQGVIERIKTLIHDQSMIFVDDACRPAEAAIAQAISKQLDWPLVVSTAGHHGFACIAKGLPHPSGLPESPLDDR